MSKRLATTIWSQMQLMGNAIPMSWGAHALKVLPEGTIDKDFDCLQGGLQIKVQGALWNGHVRVLLNWDDTYIIRIGRSRKGVWKEHLKFNNVYFDEMAQIIDSAVETAPEVIEISAVGEDTPDYYGGFNREDLQQFIMDEDNPFTCPECGARTTVEQEHANGDQLHFCENDSCHMGHMLVVEPDQLYNTDIILDWDSAEDAEIRGVVEVKASLIGDRGECRINDEEPEFFSIYIREDEGTCMVVGDYDTLKEAREALTQVLKDHDNLIEGRNSLEMVPTKPVHEKPTEYCTPVSTSHTHKPV